MPIKPAITTFGVGPCVSDSVKITGVRSRICVRPGLGARTEDAAPRIVGEINKGSRSAGQVLNLEGLGALDQLPRLREGFYFALHSVILAGRMATPSLLNTEDNEKSFANVSEVAGNSRIKM